MNNLHLNIVNKEAQQNYEVTCLLFQEPEIIANWHKQVDVSGKYVCKFCDLSYLTIQSLRHHVRIKHTDNFNAIKNTPMTSKRLNKSKCHICKKTFENVNDLLQHSHMHGLNNSQNSCLLCLVTFQDRTDLLHHMTNKHESLKKLHICAICGYSTPKLFNYKKHMNIHTGENKRKCTYCSYTTYSQPNLKIHEQTHSNEKPYVCGLEGCEYQCKTVSALRSHLLMHNKENYTLYCDKCSYSTVYRINLKKHIETHWRQKVCDQNRIDDEGISVP